MTERLLRVHFVRRFLENDLIGPDADRHDVMAMISAVLISGGLFVTCLMGLKYIMMVYQSPGRTAVAAVSDRFFLFGCSMEVMALAALLSWNALSLDARDVAILGPLPIERRTLVRAKLAAVIMVAAVFGLALNAVTSIVFPVLLVGKLRVGLLAMAGIIIVHAAVSLAAGAFGFLGVLALREGLHAALGTARFARASIPVHAALTATVMVSLLLLPGMSSDAAQRWLVRPTEARWVVPPLWFVGLHEQMMGDRLMALPYQPQPPFIARYEARVAAVYHAARPAFPPLAGAAVLSLIALVAIAFPAYWWNNRRVDASPPVRARSGRRRTARMVTTLVEGIVVRTPAARAGFWLAWRAAARSLPHRLSMVLAVAVGIAMLLVGLPVAWSARATQAIPISALAPQLVSLGAIAVGYRHIIGLPADLRANWIFKVAWLGNARQYTAGVRRFGLVGLILPAALVLLPIHAVLIGWEAAAAQAITGSLVAAVLLQLLMVGFDRLPLACPHVPSGTLNTRGPVYLMLTIGAVYGLTVAERAALQNNPALAAFVIVGVATYAALGLLDRRRRRAYPPMELDVTPDDVTQRLGLSA